MHSARFAFALAICCALTFIALCEPSAAKTLCVNPGGSNGCYSKIQSAVNHAKSNDVIDIEPGTYKEEVDIAIPLSLLGDGASSTFIDATSLPHGIFIDGYHHPGLHNVTIAGLTVENALFEGILAVNAWDVTIRDNHIVNNDKSPGLNFTGALTGCPDQPGNEIYETDETGDCGGGLHLVGVASSVVARNTLKGNADGVLISDETAQSRDNLLVENVVEDNPLECGIVLASHPQAGNVKPPFVPHHGVVHNTILGNVSKDNGVQVGGSGVGLFSDGSGKGRVSENVVIHNTLTHNGLGGVALHTHVGPAFGLPADNMDGNQIIGNVIARNLADNFDTATPGPVGININSGDGGSPVRGTIISGNLIREEDIDVAINTPTEVDVHLNDLLGGKIGVGDVCALDGAKLCTGSIDATENYWGCAVGPNHGGCTTTSGSDVRFTPWLKKSVGNDHDPD